MADELEGFFVKLGVKIDDSEFDKAERRLKSLFGVGRGSGLRRRITVVTSSLFGLAKAAGSIETSNLKMASAIDISRTSLDSWKNAASMAGVSGNRLAASMASVESKMRQLKLGVVDQGLAKNLGFLGIGYGEFASMDSDQRMKAVFGAAGGMADQETAAELVSQILGQGGREMYDYIRLTGQSLDGMLEESKQLVFQTDDSRKKAVEFNAEFNKLGRAVASLGFFAVGEVAAAFTPMARGMKEFLKAHKELIQSGIMTTARTIKGLFDTIGRIGSTVGPVLVGVFGRIGKAIQGTMPYKFVEDFFYFLQGKGSALGVVVNNWSKIRDNIFGDKNHFLPEWLNEPVKLSIGWVDDAWSLLKDAAFGDKTFGQLVDEHTSGFKVLMTLGLVAGAKGIFEQAMKKNLGFGFAAGESGVFAAAMTITANLVAAEHGGDWSSFWGQVGTGMAAALLVYGITRSPTAAIWTFTIVPKLLPPEISEKIGNGLVSMGKSFTGFGTEDVDALAANAFNVRSNNETLRNAKFQPFKWLGGPINPDVDISAKIGSPDDARKMLGSLVHSLTSQSSFLLAGSGIPFDAVKLSEKKWNALIGDMGENQVVASMATIQRNMTNALARKPYASWGSSTYYDAVLEMMEKNPQLFYESQGSNITINTLNMQVGNAEDAGKAIVSIQEGGNYQNRGGYAVSGNPQLDWIAGGLPVSQ